MHIYTYISNKQKYYARTHLTLLFLQKYCITLILYCKSFCYELIFRILTGATYMFQGLKVIILVGIIFLVKTL